MEENASDNILLSDLDLERHIETVAFAWATLHPYADDIARQRIVTRVSLAVQGVRVTD